MHGIVPPASTRETERHLRQMARSRLGVVRGLAILTLVLAACGGKPASEESKVRHLLDRLAKATEARDYRTLCEDVLAPSDSMRCIFFGIAEHSAYLCQSYSGFFQEHVIR